MYQVLDGEDDCCFKLKSNYLSIDTSSNVCFLDDKCYINLTGGSTNQDLLFSLKNRKSLIPINQITNQGKNHIKNIKTDVFKQLRVDNTYYFFIRLEDIIPAENQVNNQLSAVLVLSSKQGFIGSYLVDKKHPKYIIQKAGNILENILNYEEYSLKRIR